MNLLSGKLEDNQITYLCIVLLILILLENILRNKKRKKTNHLCIRKTDKGKFTLRFSQ